jgi:hypothetical protein
MTAPAKSPESKDARAERLAAALRENLKRRKAQAREMARAKQHSQETKKNSG